MPTSPISPPQIKKLACLAALAVVASVSCSDSTIGPNGPVIGGPAALASLGSQPLTREFTIQPGGTTVDLFGVYKVRFPASSVCDPAVSTGCTPISAPLTVTATVQVKDGRLWADFSPHLEFVNSSSRSRWVTISTDIHSGLILGNKSLFKSNMSLLRKHALLFADAIGGTPVDDAKAKGDRSLVTRVSFKNGIIWRRIMHFSGYHILTYEACDPSPDDPYCIEIDDDPEEDDDEGGGWVD